TWPQVTAENLHFFLPKTYIFKLPLTVVNIATTYAFGCKHSVPLKNIHERLFAIQLETLYCRMKKLVSRGRRRYESHRVNINQ
ncbi:hypothetical protein, partial [Lacticaseibacillus paracasei]|uniref:hypothetical protein n=1 Tax=Lacticaseibacillus paracasei TaxID=1597 RepID=UPI0034A592C6